jgi:acyl-CoA thioesterase II
MGTMPADRWSMEPLGAPLSARAWWGDTVVAESASAIRLEEPGQPPALLFPLADVHIGTFRRDDDAASCPDRGPQSTWSLDPTTTAHGRAPSQWGDVTIDTSDGHGVMRMFTDPPKGIGWPEDHVSFDPGRVYLELIDPMDSQDEAGVTMKRFPTWGDASDLMDIINVRPDGATRFVSTALASPSRPVVEGSQMLGQAIVAAGRHYPGRRMVSAHMVFLRPADAARPLAFELDELSNGRTLSSVTIDVRQDDRRCARATLLLDVTADDLIRQATPAPEVPGPSSCPSCDMSVTGRDIRVVDGAYTDDPTAAVGPPVLDAWVRFREVPEDPLLHAGLLAQFTGHMPIAAALRPHEGIGQRDAHRTISTAINAIGLSLHADVRADHWMLYHHEATFAGDGMTHSACRVHGEDGSLLASFTVDAMVRRFADPTAAVDDRRAL